MALSEIKVTKAEAPRLGRIVELLTGSTPTAICAPLAFSA